MKAVIFFSWCILCILNGCKNANTPTTTAIENPVDRIDSKYQATLIEEKLDPKYAFMPENSTTTVEYKNPEQIADFMIRGSAIGDFPEHKQLEEKDRIKANHQGGHITLIVERPEPFNMASFSLIVKKLNEDLVFRKDLDLNTLEPIYHNETENWLNVQGVAIPVHDIRPPFYVYVEDRKFHMNYKFKIE